MKVTFIGTNNEKFAYGYALEKAIEATSQSTLNVYIRVERFCRKLSELRWLLKEGRREMDVEEIDRRVSFKIIQNENDESNNEPENTNEQPVEFHLFPSRIYKTLAEYVKFLLKLQVKICEEFVIIDDTDEMRKLSNNSAMVDPLKLILSMFPPESVLSVLSHPASRQFELQRCADRGIAETIKMEWEDDRMNFKRNTSS